MAVVTPSSTSVIPSGYFGACHGHLRPIDIVGGSLSSQCAAWSKADVSNVTEYKPHENKVVLANGKEYSYKCLVIDEGLKYKPDGIEGLDELTSQHESNKVFKHALSAAGVARNYYHGWDHNKGDMICYSPKAPHTLEGADFWALYYEFFLRQNKQLGRAAQGARIQYWTPNKEIFAFPYANEVALDECYKRGVEVMFGWEMLKVHETDAGEKIATFRNVDTGDLLEKPFTGANINPPSGPY